jgi:hypothetical protein
MNRHYATVFRHRPRADDGASYSAVTHTSDLAGVGDFADTR